MWRGQSKLRQLDDRRRRGIAFTVAPIHELQTHISLSDFLDAGGKVALDKEKELFGTLLETSSIGCLFIAHRTRSLSASASPPSGVARPSALRSRRIQVRGQPLRSGRTVSYPMGSSGFGWWGNSRGNASTRFTRGSSRHLAVQFSKPISGTHFPSGPRRLPSSNE